MTSDSGKGRIAGPSRKILFVYRVCGLGGVETSIANRIRALDQVGLEGHALFGNFYGSKGESLAASLRASVGLSRDEIIALLRSDFAAIVVIDHPDFMEMVDLARPGGHVVVETHASFTPALPRLYGRFGHPRVGAVVVPSAFNKRLVEETTKTDKDVVIIPNALDFSLFHAGARGSLARELSSLEDPVVLWVGRLEDEKNPLELVEIARRLIDSHTKAHFVVVGDSHSDEEYLSQRERLSAAMPLSLEPRFTFVRGVAYGDMPKLYNLVARSGGCLLSTSRFESVPMTFIEAMACSCPVVSTDVGGVREIITDRETGFLYQQGDVVEACRLVANLIGGDGEAPRAEVVDRAAALVTERHSLSTVGALYEKLLGSLATSDGAQGVSDPRSLVATLSDDDTVVPGLVSTIIPVYNRPTLLREAVASVLDQTYEHVEVIIIDDGSTDETPAVCDELARMHSAVSVVHLPHRGLPGLAREAGRRVARGEYIQYLDSDDLLAPSKFATMVAALRARPDCDVAYCNTRRYRLGDGPEDRPIEVEGARFTQMLPACVSRRLWLTPTPLYRRSICDAVGPWSDLELWEDIEYDMRIAARSSGVHYCNEVLVDVRDHSGRLSRRDFFADPSRMAEMARATRLIYGTIATLRLDPDDEHLRWFLEDVRVIRKRCAELELEDAVRDCTEVLATATDPEGGGGDEAVEELTVRARIEPRVGLLRAAPGSSVSCPISVQNQSTISFRGGDFAFQLSSHVMSLDRREVQFHNHSVVFEPPLRPGEERVVDLWITVPSATGLYLVEIDISWGPATWLKSLGNPTALVKLLVTSFVQSHRWRLQLSGDNVAALARPGGHVDSLRLEVTRATTDVPWHIQLNHDALGVIGGRTYAVRFEGRAADKREVGVGVSMAHPPWQGLGGYRRVELAPEWRAHEVGFTAAADDDNARIHFDAGGSAVGLELRAVQLLDATSGQVIEPPPLSYLARFQMDFGERPLSEWWGTDRGLAIHRYYLESFLTEFAADVRGRCLEFQNPQYTRRFGGSAVTALDILHIDDSNPQATLVADLTKPNSLPSDTFDCIVCTHVLHMIYEVEKAVAEIFRILKPGGVLLVAVPHISMYGPEFGEIWRFTPEGLRVLLSRVFGEGNVTWRAYGNSLTAAGEIRGLASHEFHRRELDSHDMRFAVEVCGRAAKAPPASA